MFKEQQKSLCDLSRAAEGGRVEEMSSKRQAGARLYRQIGHDEDQGVMGPTGGY